MLSSNKVAGFNSGREEAERLSGPHAKNVLDVRTLYVIGIELASSILRAKLRLYLQCTVLEQGQCSPL